VDLFCGAGGLSYGFELAGFQVVAAVDNDAIGAQSYKLHHPSVPLLLEDIASVSGTRLRRIARGPIDVVIGGPSCQGYSTHGKRDPNDPRNYLFRHFVRIVSEVRPLWVVMENVKGLLAYDKGRYRAEIHRAFEKIGYKIESRILLAADYGVPQLRERLFFLATRTQSPVVFPAPTHCPLDEARALGLKPYVTVRDAIGDLPAIGVEGEAFEYAGPAESEFQRYARRHRPKCVTLHRARRVSPLAMSLILKIPQGNGVRAIPEKELPARFRRMRTISTGALRKDCTTLYYRLSWQAPAKTITCYFTNVSSGPFVHPRANRALTPREAARLQSFPDNYEFVERQVQRQIGNAVPPLLARAVGLEIRKQINLYKGRVSDVTLIAAS